MFPKALWMKEWKHSNTIFYSLLILFLIQYPIAVGLKLDTWRSLANDPSSWELSQWAQVNSVFSMSFLSILAIGVVFVLAGYLIGSEKNSKRHDFSMALPFSRTQMYLTKYALGFLSIVVSYTVMFWLAVLIIYQSEFRNILEHLDMAIAYTSPLLGYIVIYSLAMLIGAISGGMRSQMVLTFIFLILPQGFTMMLVVFLETHGLSVDRLLNQYILEDLFWLSYMNIMTESNLLYPLIATLLFTGLGLVAFKFGQSEYAGEFLMIRALHPLFAVGILVCSTLLGGLILGGVVAYDAADLTRIMVYWLGGLLGLFISWKITKRLLRY